MIRGRRGNVKLDHRDKKRKMNKRVIVGAEVSDGFQD